MSFWSFCILLFISLRFVSSNWQLQLDSVHLSWFQPDLGVGFSNFVVLQYIFSDDYDLFLIWLIESDPLGSNLTILYKNKNCGFNIIDAGSLAIFELLFLKYLTLFLHRQGRMSLFSSFITNLFKTQAFYS